MVYIEYVNHLLIISCFFPNYITFTNQMLLQLPVELYLSHVFPCLTLKELMTFFQTDKNTNWIAICKTHRYNPLVNPWLYRVNHAHMLPDISDVQWFVDQGFACTHRQMCDLYFLKSPGLALPMVFLPDDKYYLTDDLY